MLNDSLSCFSVLDVHKNDWDSPYPIRGYGNNNEIPVLDAFIHYTFKKGNENCVRFDSLSM